MVEIREHTFSAATVTLNYAEMKAESPPLVLLHGGSNRWQSFQLILPELAQQFHVFAPDLRGHGKSAWVPGTYRLQDYADDIVLFLKQVVGEPAFLLGHSFGGIIALLVAAQAPECVRALVIEDSPLSLETWSAPLKTDRGRMEELRAMSGGQKSVDELTESMKNTLVPAPGSTRLVPFREVLGDDSPVFGELAQDLYQTDPDTFSALLERFDRTAGGFEMIRILPAIRCPVLLCQADPKAGGAMTDAEVQAALRLLAQPAHMQWQGIGHGIHHVRPAQFTQAVAQYFNSLEGNSAKVNHTAQ